MLILRRISRLEQKIFIQKRVIRPQESPLLREVPSRHPLVASYATALSFNPSVTGTLGESIALLQRQGLTVSSASVPVSTAPDNLYVTLPSEQQAALGYQTAL